MNHFPQYQGAPEGYVDLPYDVFLAITVPATSVRQNQFVKIDNFDAPFYWLGLSGTLDDIQVIIKDYAGQYFMNTGIWIPAIAATDGRAYPIMPAVLYPKGTQIQVDLETPGPAPVAVELCFWGIKRYPEKDAPC